MQPKRLHLESLERRLVLDGTPLGNGEIALGQVSPAEPTDLYTFTANAGELVWVAVKDQLERRRFHALTDDFHFDLEVESPSGQLYTDIGLGAIQSFVADATGEYEIRISDFIGEPHIRDYEVRLVIAPQDIAFTYEHDAFLGDGEHFSADLEIGDLAIVQFEATAGAGVFPEWENPFVPGEGGSMFVTLVAPDGQVVGDSTTLDDSKNFTAPATGVYTAVVTEREFDDDLSFSFTVASLPGEVDYGLPSNQLLALGGQREAIVATDDQHLVQFDAEAGQQLLASLYKTRGSGLGNPRLRIVDPLGNVLNDRIDDSQIHQLFVAPTAGLYTAIITKDPNQSSLASFGLDYTFSLDTFPLDSSLVRNALLNSGELFTIPTPSDSQHLVQFQAAAGSKVFGSYGEVVASVSNGFLDFRLLDPQGNEIFEDVDDIGIGFLLNAPMTGLYTAVLVYHFNSSNGLTFSIATLPGGVDDSLPNNDYLTNGELREATLGVAQQHIVQFDVEAGSTLTAELDMTGGDDRARPRMRLIDPAGRVLSNDTGPLLTRSLTASVTGLYTAVVTEVGSNESFAYRLQVGAFGVGDYNRDGSVDAADQVFWSEHYGAVEGLGLQADGNGNGRVDAGDYAIWRDSQPSSPAPAAAMVPDPIVEPPQRVDAATGPDEVLPINLIAREAVSRPQRFWIPLRDAAVGGTNTARASALLLALAELESPSVRPDFVSETATNREGRGRSDEVESATLEAALSEFNIATGSQPGREE